MEKENSCCRSLHPMVIFWLGVLTGALIVGLAFLYGSLQASEYQNAVLKAGTLKSTATTQLQVNPIGGDRNIVTPIGGDRN